MAAAGRGGSAAALARFPAVHVRQRLGTDGINVSLLRGFKVLTVYMVGTDCYAPMGPPDGGGRSWRWRIGDPLSVARRRAAQRDNIICILIL